MSSVPITENTPLRLDRAAELAFPGGGMTASGLRKERDRGRLVTEMIAGKEYVTLAAIAEMRAKCLGPKKAQGFGAARSGEIQPRGGSRSDRDGSSETERNSSLPVAFQRRLRRLSNA